jgi:hypothetical protein
VAEDPAPEIGVAQIDAVLKYLPIFEEPGYQFGEWITREGESAHFSYEPEVDEFVKSLYEQGFIIQFDWPTWREEVRRYRSDPATLAEADLLTIRKLLTAHVRADRFVEGNLASIFKEGHLTAILRRLKDIRREIADE